MEEVTFDQYPIGAPLGPIEECVSPDLVSQYLKAIEPDGPNPAYRGGGPFGAPIVPYVVIENLAVGLEPKAFKIKDAVRGTVHYSTEIECLRPAFVGETIHISGATLSKEVKRGKYLTTVGFTVTGERGDVIMRGKNSRMHLPSGTGIRAE